MPIVAPLWPAFLIYHRFCGVRRSQRHNLTPIAPESSIREAVSAPTATLLSGPASCLDAGHAFLCAIAFSGENTTLRATSISFGELRDARFARHNPRRPWGPGLIKESRSVVGRLSAFRAPLQSLPRKQRRLNKQQQQLAPRGRLILTRDGEEPCAGQTPCHAVKKRAAEPPSKVFGGKCSKERKQLTLRKRAAKAKSFVPSNRSSPDGAPAARVRFTFDGSWCAPERPLRMTEASG